MGLPLWVRFFIYGCAGVCFEILFTGIKSFLHSRYRDWSFRGKSYIWMFLIYGLLAFLFEPVHNLIRDLPWPVRGMIYVVGFFLVEWITGWSLRAITGKCPWDYSGKKYSVMGLIRLDYAPIWFAFCMAMEPLHDLLLRLRIV
jgi:uncharacterized membrane protein